MFLAVGTAKGLFRFRSPDRMHWEALDPVLIGEPIYATAYQPSEETFYAGVSSVFYGPSVRRSRDFGATWDNGGSGLSYAADDPEKVTRVWSLRPVGDGFVYAGVEASGLFRSRDSGDTWEEVASLRQHPTHAAWFPGFGGKCLHTITPDPFEPGRLYIACSTGGVYRSDDDGETWRPMNRGIAAAFMPDGDQYPEAGQCVHKFVCSPAQAGRMWLQNHGGVYRSDDGGDSWQSVAEGLPSDFGFPIVTHPLDPDMAYVIPVIGWGRWFPEQKATVYRTRDAGRNWEPLRQGLPEGAYSGVIRDAFTADNASPLGLYFGTTSGEVYHSTDTGESWHRIAERLPRIYSVVAFED